MSKQFPYRKPTLAVSVVIPLYNAEKFIGACLSSILSQTFKNFEVIIVDDCSTDNSVAIAKNYLERFSGRLKILHMKKNSGCPGVPINKGIAFSRGEYIFLMDDDDLISEDTLETLYHFAETYQADVVYSESYFYITDAAEKPFPKSEDISLTHSTIDKPTLETEDIKERLQKFLQNKFEFPAWTKLVRRDLLIENEIIFSDISIYHDMIWTLQVLYFSKRLLKIPDAVYFYRLHSNSQTRKCRSMADYVKIILKTSIEGLSVLDNFLSKQNFFQENTALCLELLNYFEQIFIALIINGSNALKVNLSMAYDLLKDSLSAKFGEQGNLITYLCTALFFSKINQIKITKRADELEQQLKNFLLEGN